MEMIARREKDAIGEVESEAKNHIRVAGNLVILSRSYRTAGKRPPVRGNIVQFSQGSACRMRRYLRECQADYKTLITLTYPCGYGLDGKESKDHLRRFIQECKRFAGGESDWSIFWFMEFTNAGRIHYHLLSTHRYPKEWVSRKWFDIVGSDDARHLAAGTRIEKIRSSRGGMASYVTKYAAKACQKVVPPDFGWVGRFWGVAGLRSIVAAVTSFDDTELARPSVRRRITSMISTLKELVERGKAKKLENTNEFSSVWVVNDVREMKVLAAEVEMLDLHLWAARGAHPAWNYIELKPEWWEV